MALKIRLQRHGASHRPFYRMVVTEAAARRDGRFVEVLGTYEPQAVKPEDQLLLKLERIDYWKSVGAKPSDTAASLIRRARRGHLDPPIEAPKPKAKPAPEPEAAPEADAPAEEAAAPEAAAETTESPDAATPEAEVVADAPAEAEAPAETEAEEAPAEEVEAPAETEAQEAPAETEAPAEEAEAPAETEAEEAESKEDARLLHD